MYKIILILLVFIPFQVFSADLDTTVTEAFELYSVSNYAEAAPMFEEAYYMAKNQQKIFQADLEHHFMQGFHTEVLVSMLRLKHGF